VEPIQIANRRVAIGSRPGTAAPQVTFGVVDQTLATFARALGIPQSDIAGNRLPVGNNIATATIDGLLIQGTYMDGGAVYITSWGNSVDVSDVSVNYAGTGVAAIPVTVKPGSGLLFATV